MKSERGNVFLKKLDFYGGIPASLLSAAWRHCTRLFSRRRLKNEIPEKIGIICFGAIGDLLLASALINGIRKKLPAAHIEVLCSRANAQALPLIAEIDSGYSFHITAVHKILKHARAQKYDILLDTSQWSRLGTFICNFSGAIFTAGFQTQGQFRSAGYDSKVPHLANRHELENFLELGRAVWPDFDGVPILKSLGGQGQPRRKIVYCHMWPAPGPGSWLKEWPQTHWAMLAEKLLSSGFKVIFTGSAGDAARNESFLDKYSLKQKGVETAAGKWNLVELGTNLQNASALVSVNTGIMHLGAIIGIPVVALHGATNPRRWGPVGARTISLLPPVGESAYLNLGFEYPANARPSLPNLPVENVLSALETLGVINNL